VACDDDTYCRALSARLPATLDGDLALDLDCGELLDVSLARVFLSVDDFRVCHRDVDPVGPVLANIRGGTHRRILVDQFVCTLRVSVTHRTQARLDHAPGVVGRGATKKEEPPRDGREREPAAVQAPGAAPTTRCVVADCRTTV